MWQCPECMYAQSNPTLCDYMDCSLPGSSVHGIFQTRILEWVAISFSRGSFWPRDRTHVSCVSCMRPRFDLSGRTPGRGNDNLLQYFCVGNHMDRGAWLAMTVYGVAKSWTQLSTHARSSQRTLVITLKLRLKNLSTFLRSTPVLIMWFVLTLRNWSNKKDRHVYNLLQYKIH